MSQDLLKRAPFAAALAFLTATAAHAQSDSFCDVPVRSCPYADSLLGWWATICARRNGYYDGERGLDGVSPISNGTSRLIQDAFHFVAPMSRNVDVHGQ